MRRVNWLPALVAFFWINDVTPKNISYELANWIEYFFVFHNSD
jgi:hypothetical protein